MSKRRIERDLDEVSEEVLTELSPSARLQLWIEAQANGKEQWLDRLAETCPTHAYQHIDRAFKARGRYALLFLNSTVYSMHTMTLQHELLRTIQQSSWVLDGYRDGEPSQEEVDQAAERADLMNFLVAEVYVQYHALQRFADEILGVDLATWVELHPDGPLVLDAVEELLDDDVGVELAEQWLDEKADESVTLDELMEFRYEGLAQMWNEAFAELPDS